MLLLKANHHRFTITLWMLLTLLPVAVWIVLQPNQNIWVTLAKTLQKDNMCLSMESIENLLSYLLCLLGIPLTANDDPYTG